MSVNVCFYLLWVTWPGWPKDLRNVSKRLPLMAPKTGEPPQSLRAAKLFPHEDDRPEPIPVRPERQEPRPAPRIKCYGKAAPMDEVSAAGSPEEIYNRTVPQLESHRHSLFAERMWASPENRRDT